MVTAYSVVVLSPIVFINSALWAQCDVIYTFFIIIVLISLYNEHFVRAFIFYGVAFAFKLQAIFFMPFLLIVYFMKKKFSVVYFAIIPVVMSVLSIPCLIMGRRISEIFFIYWRQTKDQGAMSLNYPSFWILLTNVDVKESYIFYKYATIVFTACILVGWMAIWITKHVNLNKRNMLYMSFILVYSCVLFLPAMHERYGYVYEILGIPILFHNRKTIPLWGVLQGISLMTYGVYLHGSNINMSILSVINLAVYVSYSLILEKQLIEDSYNLGVE